MGVMIGLAVFLVAIPAIVASAQPRPVASYESRDVSRAEFEELMGRDGVMFPQDLESSARMIEGPGGSILVVEEPQYGQRCLMLVVEDDLNHVRCGPQAWPIVVTMPVREFPLDPAVVKQIEDAGSNGAMLIYSDEKLAVWPTGAAHTKR